MRLTTSPPSCAEYHEIWETKPPGTLWATTDLLRDCVTFTFDFSQLELLNVRFVAVQSDTDVTYLN
jgi:hypothetical protein